MSHTVKLFERIANHMVRTIVDLGNVFRRGRSTTGCIACGLFFARTVVALSVSLIQHFE